MQNKIIWELVRILSGCISAVMVLYTIVLRLLFFLLPDSTTLNRKVIESDQRLTVITIMIITTVGWYASHKLKRIKMMNPYLLERSETIMIAISSVFLSYFLTKSFSLFAAFQNIGFIIVFGLMVFFLTQIIELFKSYSRHDITSFLQHLEETQKDSTMRKQTIRGLVIGVSLILLAYVMLFSARAIYKSVTYRHVFHEKLYIDAVSPDHTTYAYKVTLTGYNFGPEYNRKRQSLISTYGPVMTDFWSEERIVFTVPLYWKVGGVDLWIERPNTHDEKRSETSNKVHMTVLNRWDYFPTANDTAPTRFTKRILRTLYLDYWNNLAAFAEQTLSK